MQENKDLKKVIKVAERMLKHDYDIEEIIEVTMLSRDKIREIENRLIELSDEKEVKGAIELLKSDPNVEYVQGTLRIENLK